MTDMRTVAQTIDDALPDIARGVIERYLDQADQATLDFLATPDDREQHQTQWHQWGIITHTRVFLRQFDDDVPRYLQQWGHAAAVDAHLEQSIDGASKLSLLRIAILLHDIGKFATRTHSRSGFHFWNHERLSGEIIRNSLDLSRYGLTAAQIEYIALTAQDHFVLGIVRKRVREQGTYDAAFVGGGRFRKMALDIRAEHPEDFIEIGVLFLGDSLAKVDPAHGPERAVSQYEVNIMVARRYLDIVLHHAPVSRHTLEAP